MIRKAVTDEIRKQIIDEREGKRNQRELQSLLFPAIPCYSVLFPELKRKEEVEMKSNQPFQITKEDHITWLTLNRPEKRNAMNPAFFSRLLEIFPEFDEDPSVRVVIIKGEGKSFTAGLDLTESAELFQSPTAASREKFKSDIQRLQDSMSVIEQCRKPVIAAIHSHCIGGGVDLICACDIRLASRDAVFAIRETKMAMVADLGTLQRLPHIIGQGRTRELVLTGRDFNAGEALEFGLITHMYADRETMYQEAKKMADEIAFCSPLAVQGAKEVLNYSRDQGVYAGLNFVAQKNAAILPSEDVVEAFQAFMEKRTPKFTGK